MGRFDGLVLGRPRLDQGPSDGAGSGAGAVGSGFVVAANEEGR